MIVAGLLALALATAAPALHAAPVSSSSTSFVTSDHVRLNVLEAGQAKQGQPTIAFIPGWSMPASLWSNQLAALSATHKVVALDPRGQGESDIAAGGYTTERRAEDIREFVARYAPVVLVTWSMGSLEALQYLHAHGHSKVRALAIVDSSVGEGPAPAPAPRDAPPSGFQEELRRDRAKTVDDFLRAIFRTPQSDEAITALREGALRMPLEASLSLFPGQRIPRDRWRKTVHAFPKPLLYAITPQFRMQAQSLKAHRPATQVEVFENAGHALFVDEPDRFSALLSDFLRKHRLTVTSRD